MAVSGQFEYDVFLSHASADKAAVRELAERLCEHQTLNIQHRPSNDSLLRCSAFEVGRSMFNRVTHEQHTALFRDATDHQRRLIPLRLDDREVKEPLKQFAWNAIN